MSKGVSLSSSDLHKVFKELIEAQNLWYDLGLALGLPSSTLDSIKSQSDSSKVCLREMLKEWLKRTNPKPLWKALIEALRDVTVNEKQLADKLEKRYCSLSDVTATIKDQDDSPTSASPPVGLLSQTKDILKLLKNVQSDVKPKLIKDVIDKFVVTSIQLGIAPEIVLDQLQTLHKDELLISEDLLREAKKLVTEEHSKHTPVTISTTDSSKSHTPLFCKNTVYHASICSHVVSTCEVGDYQKFFKNNELVPGHSFTAVSMSRSKQNTFLIAKMGESTYFFAFKSEMQLLQWGTRYKSFSEGIMTLSEQFPVRFIIELLNQQCRIILTGFSFGGLLAAAVAAQVWDSPYISSSLLKDNMTCITFGQPHVAIQVIQKVVRRRPEIVSTTHAIYLEEDLIPSIMSFLDESWSDIESQNDQGLLVSLPTEVKAPFLDPITTVLIDNLGNLQMSLKEMNSSVTLDSLRTKLKELFPKITKQSYPAYSTNYLITCEKGAGLVLREPTGDKENAFELTLMNIESLNASLFDKITDVFQHSFREFSGSLFVGYLEKSPSYSFPPQPKHAPSDVSGLKPLVDEVHVHHHGDQTAIVLEGSNLWFCHKVSFRRHTVPISSQEISGSAIQFNVPRDNHKAKEATERVTLYTYFSSKPIKLNGILVSEKGYSIKTRQKQLARCSPSQVIELAYLSALLEQNADSKAELLSHKLEVIAKFLEDVVRVVPFESISYAIANCSYDNAVLCYEAMISCGIPLPKSMLMLGGLSHAEGRMEVGYVGRSLSSLPFELRHIGIFGPGYNREARIELRGIDEDRGEVKFAVAPVMHDSDILLDAPTELTIDVRKFPRSQTNKEILENLVKISKSMMSEKAVNPSNVPIVSGVNIEVIYPMKQDISHKKLNSPVQILKDGKAKLSALASKVQQNLKMTTMPTVLQQTRKGNIRMLEVVNSIRIKDIDLCTSLLGGFMDQQNIEIGLCRHQQETAFVLHAAASVGVWALFSIDYSHIQPILAKCHGNQLLVKILDYVQSISGVLPAAESTDSGPYAGKLQFMVQGMTKTVTCNTHLISYSLERQLVELCKDKEIDTTVSLTNLVRNWSKLFKQTTLSLVDERYRPLISRWLKWALMIHNLREELASYTAVGVAGLVNSGKSKIVNTLFGIMVPTGTTEAKRTTVPFLYNLSDSVEGLDVVDFPGVDDEDDTIGELADLLLTIAQIVLFVVDYRKVHTQSAKKWLERLKKEEVPVLICLTFGDKLYAEQMTKKGEHPNKEDMKMIVKDQLTVVERKLGKLTHSHKIQFFSFSQDNDSVLNSDEGREKLKEVGIESPQEVGEWLVKVFRKDFGQDELADRLEPFMFENIQKVT